MTPRVHINLPALERRGRARAWRERGLPYADALRSALARAVRSTLAAEDVADGVVSVTLLEDDAIRALNRQYLERDRATDVIAFSLAENGDEAPHGDVYIGVERALEQAADAGATPTEELVRLGVHGTLHVLGHDHPEDASRTQSVMWQRQETLVRAVMRELET